MGKQGLNPRHSTSEADVLPTELFPNISFQRQGKQWSPKAHSLQYQPEDYGKGRERCPSPPLKLLITSIHTLEILACTRGFEPLFTTPFTGTTFVAPFGYVQIIWQSHWDTIPTPRFEKPESFSTRRWLQNGSRCR